MKNSIAALIVVLILTEWANAQNVANKWRGPAANGIYDQSGLLEKWPDNGPTILWVTEELGEGFSSPVFANGKIYVSGVTDNVGYIFILSEQGKLLKKIAYGEEFIQSYPGSRSTPTIVDDLIYMHTGVGKVLCISEKSGEIKWVKDLFVDFDGSNLRFGMTESLVVDGDKVYAAPGGKTYNVLALNRLTGDLVWTSPGKGCLSAYSTPLLFDYNNEKMMVIMMGQNILGLNRESGQLKWSYPYKNQRGIHPNTPLYHDGELYCFSGYGYGGVKLKIAADNNSVEKRFWCDSLQSKMGGAVLLNGRMYGSGDNVRRWYCVDWNTGEVLFTEKELANGVVISANGMLYFYTDRGELALVKPEADRFDVISKTMVTHGTAQHWAHPVIYQGILYVRHGKALVAYDIRKK